MPRTTPPRPLDVTSVFPELIPLARTTTRLHPRPGSPTVHESSVAGPLLWPAGEPWPVCAEEHASACRGNLRSLDGVRRYRQLLNDAWARPRPAGTNLLTADEQAELDRIRAGHPSDQVDAAVPLLPIVQLYARDTPGLNGPDGCDLLQVLWCPFEHNYEALPGVELRWRRVADVTTVLTDPPVPFLVEHADYVPEPCAAHPEQVREWDGGTGSWRPIEDAEADHATTIRYAHTPTMVTIGRGYGMQIYTCPTSHDHPPSTVMQ